MDLQPNKIDGIVKPITNNRISASEWNQLVGSCMAFITAAGFTPDANDNSQFLNAFIQIAQNLGFIGANVDLSNLSATGEAHFDSTYVKLQTGVTQENVDYVVSTQLPTAENNYSWNRVYKSGWVEQGGIVDRSQTDTVNLGVPMADNYYSIFMFSRSGHVYAYQNTASTTTSFKFNSADDNTDNNDGIFYWEVKGLKSS